MTWSRQSERKLSPIAKLTSSNRTNSGPTHQNSGGRKSLGFGTAAGAKDIRTKSRSHGVAGFRRDGGLSPGPGGDDWGVGVPGSAPRGLMALPVLSSFHRFIQEDSQDVHFDWVIGFKQSWDE